MVTATRVHEPSSPTSWRNPESRGTKALKDRHDEETQMADLPSYPEAHTDLDTRPDRESTRSAPRWVFVVAIVVVLLIVVLHLTGILGPGLH